MGLRFAVGGVIVACLASCSGFTADDECREGDTAPCETACGPGTMACEDGAWGACQTTTDPECIPGEVGTCSLGADVAPGLWLCSDTCRQGPCLELCLPGDTFECDAQCGPGQMFCQPDGTWGPCLEYVIPDCRPGEVERCPEGELGHRRCGDDCRFGPCDGDAACAPGERAVCSDCSSQLCLEDGTWGECQRDATAVCEPGDSVECAAACGAGRQVCMPSCEWTECIDIAGACTPGQREICPGALYCGLAFRVCGPSCMWLDCVEAGG